MYRNGKRLQKKKTSIKHNTLMAYYNESFTFNRFTERDIKKNVILILTFISNKFAVFNHYL